MRFMHNEIVNSEYGENEHAFIAIGSKPVSPGYSGGERMYPMANVMLSRGNIAPHFRRRGGQLERTPSGDNDLSKATGQPRQLSLLSVHPSTISAAFSHPHTSAAIPTLLGAAIDEGRRLGYGLTYDTSLSSDSAPIARRGMALGVVEPRKGNPTAEVTNSLGEMTKGYNVAFASQASEWQDMDSETLTRARHTARQILGADRAARRPAPEAPSGPSYDQPHLPFR